VRHMAWLAATLFTAGCAGHAGEFVPRVDFQARFEPCGNRILHGAGQGHHGDYSSFDRYADAVKRVPAVTVTYVSPHHQAVGWRKALERHLIHHERQSGVLLLPQIGTHFNRDEDRNRVYCEELAAGKWDHEVLVMLAEIKAIERPVFLRPGFEFNGEWNGYRNPDAYRRAFRHFHGLIQRANARNIALLWCFNPDGKNPAGRKGDYLPYYPGDDVVDWWAFDLFRIGSAFDPHSQQFFQDASRHKKPVMITECTPFQFDIKDPKRSGQVKWFQPFFELVRNTPEIKGVCYINWHWADFPQWQDWGDARLEENPAVAARYADFLRDPVWIHGFPKADAATLLHGLPF
jgi:hypothetical protein